jgi:hypothetical protein
MMKQSNQLRNVDSELFDRVMRITEQIGNKEEHFNNLQTGYRKLASTWLLGAFAACGYVLKSDSDIPFDKWYFVFGICAAASGGLAILWMMDLKVYQKLLGAFFRQGVILELEYYRWLPPARINILRSQKTGKIQSKVQYFYFYSIVILQLLGIISIWNFGIDVAYKIVFSSIIFSGVLTAQILFIRASAREREKFRNKGVNENKEEEAEVREMISHWLSITQGKSHV